MGNSYENNEPQRRKERREKNLCESVSSVDKFSFLLVRRRRMGNSYMGKLQENLTGWLGRLQETGPEAAQGKEV